MKILLRNLWDMRHGVAFKQSFPLTLTLSLRGSLHDFWLAHWDHEPRSVLQQFIRLCLFLVLAVLPVVALAQRTGGPPVINQQPQSQIVAAGTDVTNRVAVAQSYTPVRYQWRQRLGYDLADLAGATNSTLVISNAALRDAGAYAVVVANAAGSITSDTATLTVVQVSADPSSVSPGASVTLRVSAAGSPIGGYQWKFGGMNISGATKSTLVLTNVQLANAGTYFVAVTNAVGSLTLSSRLVVDPTFTKITDSPITKDAAGGGGASWADYNNDGWLDLFVSRFNSTNLLYRNNADGTFTKVTAASAGTILTSRGTYISPVWADFDNDGHLDLFNVPSFGPNRLYKNLGDGSFKELSRAEAGDIVTDGPTSNFGSWADYDRDGYLDLVVVNNSGIRNYLYHNNGDGSFIKITNSVLASAVPGGSFGAGVAWGDFDNDGDDDLFVTGYDRLNELFINNGDGTFTKSSLELLSPRSFKSQAATWADFDNDGNLDLFVARSNQGNTLNLLFRNNGDGTFTQDTSGVVASEPSKGVQSVIGAWGDYDNDGYVDLFVANTAYEVSSESTGPTKSFLYHNNGDGAFAKITTGSPVNDSIQSYHACWGDYDNDGFLDLFVLNDAEGSPGNNFLYHNNGNTNAWIKFKLVGTLSNRSAIGAKVRVLATVRGQPMWQLREVISGSGYGSPNQIEPHFGLGDATNSDTVRIEWPSGIIQEMRNVAVTQFLTVTESVLIVQPKAQEFIGGADFTFNVATNSTSSTNYQWRFNGTDLAGETNAVLSVRSVGASSAGKYTVVATLPNGDTVESTAAILKPAVPPAITAQPQSLTVDPGGTATFQVSATGSPPLLYQWRLNEAPIDGATTATLTVTNVQPENAGDYTVEVRNLAGTVTSTNAILSLVGAAMIAVHPKDQSVSLGANVTFSVSASGTPPFTYQWRLNGADIPGATNRTLSITNVEFANNDQRYNVFVRNALGPATSRGALLAVDPTFTKITSGSIVTSGGTSKGAAWADFNDDGWIDLFVVNTFNEKNFLYQNNRDGSFTRITTGAIVNDIGDFDTCAWGDYDNDGNIDIVVTSGLHNGGRNFLYRNLGNATFERITTGPIVSVSGNFTGTAWGDYDRDGFLDLFIANWGPNRLFHNIGNGTFTQITAGPIVKDSANSSNGSWADFDNDGDLDLVVDHAGDSLSQPTYVYRNEGDGAFTSLTAPPITTEGGLSVGCAWGDYDNDGLPDLFVANYRGYAIEVSEQKNFLYHNEGNGVFTKITEGAIVNDLSDSFGASWGDYDNDGFLDLVVSNIKNKDNFLYHSNGDGTFSKVTAGSVVHDGGESVACVWGDYNNDGFLDLFVANGANTGPQNDFLYLNNTNGNNWISIRCIGTAANRSAIGAKVRVKAFYQNEIRWQLREISGGNGSSGQNDLRASFGLGDATNTDTVRIEWPSGIVQELHNLAAKQFLTNTEPNVTITPKLQELVLGSDMSFTVSNNLTGPLIYQWRINGADIVGQTNATLVVSNAQEANLGKYSVALTNPVTGDFVISASALLRLPGFPQITVQPQSQTVDRGGQAILQVTAIGAEPLYYQWRLFEDNVPGATNATLTITNVQPVHAGDYTVVVSNLVGSVTSQGATLNLLGAPGISLQPKSQSVSLGATVSFVVNVFGTTPFNFQWRSNGVDIASATNRTLTLTNATIEFGANYSVVVTNSLSSVTSQSARLDVDPSFTKITDSPIVNASGYGSYWGDYDDDGNIDLYVSSPIQPANLLFRNNGDGSFTRITSGNAIVDERGTTATFEPAGGSWVDYDNDGRLDLLVGNSIDGSHQNLLYHNEGNGVFTKITSSPLSTGVVRSFAPAWGDYDNDGNLDVFLINYGGRNLLYRNKGSGVFEKITSGDIVNESLTTAGIAWGDYDNDGDLDLVSANDSGRNYLYRNNGDGTFTRLNPFASGVTSSIGCNWADYDNDGDLDVIFNGYNGKSALFRNNGDGSFTRVLEGPLVNDPGSDSQGFAFGDYDNDGWQDIFVANSSGRDYLYHNNGDGAFTRVTAGSIANDTVGSFAGAWGDYNNDGFPDLTITRHSAKSALYLNNGNANNWIKFKLVGTLSNRGAIGAKVRVHATLGGKTFWQLRELSGGSGWEAQNDVRPNFGLGDATVADTVRIEWPSGSVQELHNVAVKQTLTVVEPPRLGGLARQTDDSVQLNLIGVAGSAYRVETSSNLFNWTSLVTITNRTRTEIVVDTNAANFSQRFYRALVP